MGLSDGGHGSLGGLSGFMEYDGIVRLLRIRNPHGVGEWKGRFSDGSSVWEKLLLERRRSSATTGSSGVVGDEEVGMERTMVNDGTFWIGYDSFLYFHERRHRVGFLG